MGVFHMVVSPEQASPAIADRDRFLSAAQQRWPRCRVFDRNTLDRYPDILIYPVFGDYEVEVSHFPDGRTIACDGPLEEPGVAEVAAWARSLNPDPELILWLIDDDFTGHAVLTPGITPDEIRASWVDHAEHDPAVEYPEYFGN